MKHKEQIIHLIMQDMKHNRLLAGLNQLGFSCEKNCYDLDIYKTVAYLMGIRDLKAIGEDWFDLYMSYTIGLNKRNRFDDLEKEAAACYEELMEILN